MICDVLEVKLELQTIQKGKKVHYEVLESISLNGTEFEQDFDIFSLFSDTHLKDKSDYQKKYEVVYDKEHIQHNRSIKMFDGIWSSVYLETCSCGAPGCAGIWNGVRVYKKKKYFKYVAKKSDGYDKGILNSGKWNLTFTKENIFTIRKHIIDFYIQNSQYLGKYYQPSIELCLELKTDPNLFK